MTVRVRFQEVDVLQVVWHGHYLSYLEDARMDFGRAYGISYNDMRAAGVAAPIVSLACDYLLPARFDDSLQIVTRLCRRETPKLEFHFEISRESDGVLLLVAQTTQALTDAADGSLLLTMPPFLRDFYARWDGSMRSSDE